MNTPCTFILAFLTAGLAVAQDTPAPAPAAAPAQSEMQKWIATTDEQWQASFKRGVTDVHETELNKVKLQYLTMLEDGVKKASGASDLDGALALRTEQKRFGDASLLPGSDPFPAQDDAADAAAVKQILAAIRAQLAKLEKDSAARAKTLHAKYDQVLAQAQTQLTQRQRLDDALLVKNKRDEVAAAWLAGIPATPVPATAEQPKPKPPVPIPTVATASTPETAGGNLFKNPNFENGTDGWEITDFGKNGAIAIDTKELHNGKTTLRIELLEGDFVFVKQLVGKPNTHYRLSGYIKTKNVEPVNKGGKQGACLMVGFTADVRGGSTPPIQKTNSWKKVSVDFTTTAKNSITVGAGFGSYASNVTGTAWFSELSLTELSHTSKK